MTKPQLEIEVDPQNGVWSSSGMPMIFMPRHFFLNNHLAIEQALGREAYAQLLYRATYDSAWQWCERESKVEGLRGLDVFRHYMKRVSQRGWAQFLIEQLSETDGTARMRVDHSAFVLGGAKGEKACYMFTGWFPGALEWAAKDLGRSWRLRADESQCAAAGRHDHCIFEVAPDVTPR